MEDCPLSFCVDALAKICCSVTLGVPTGQPSLAIASLTEATTVIAMVKVHFSNVHLTANSGQGETKRKAERKKEQESRVNECCSTQWLASERAWVSHAEVHYELAMKKAS